MEGIGVSGSPCPQKMQKNRATAPEIQINFPHPSWINKGTGSFLILGMIIDLSRSETRIPLSVASKKRLSVLSSFPL